MKQIRFGLAVLLLAACSASTSDATPDPQSSWTEPTIIEGAVSLRVVAGPDGNPWVGWTADHQLRVALIDLDTGDLLNPVVVADDVFDHPLERAALAAGPNSTVEMSWISNQGQVHWASLANGAVQAEEIISGTARNETALVQMIATNDQRTVISWLEDSTLSVATPGSGRRFIERENVDQLTCDCCHPVPVQIGDEYGIGYRDLVASGDGDVRDIRFITGEISGPAVGESVEVADDPWQLDACPLSGPAVASRDGEVLIAWMDARQAVHPDQTSSSIWFDRSEDGGRTFGADIRLTTDEANHGTPAMAIDASGRIHLIWERRTADKAELVYRQGDGDKWNEPVALVSGDIVPTEPTASVVGDLLIYSWVAGGDGYLSIESIESR